MYFWNVSKLAEELQEGKVDEKERLKYFLATFVFWVLGAQLFVYYGGSFGLMRLIPVVANVTAGALGIYDCYGANRGGDNKDFIGRIVCLGWPCAVKTVAFLIVSFLIVLVVSSTLECETTMVEAFGRWFRWSLFVVIWIYFAMVKIYIATAAQPK